MEWGRPLDSDAPCLRGLLKEIDEHAAVLFALENLFGSPATIHYMTPGSGIYDPIIKNNRVWLDL